MLVPYLMRLPIEHAKGCRSMLSVSECNLSHFNIFKLNFNQVVS
jgi:hypothetical protein